MILWNILRVVIAAVTIVAVAELSKRYPRYGALLLSLPLISLLAFSFGWMQHRDLTAISKMARETLILVPLSLPFFIPLAMADHFGWGFWPAFAAGVVLASATIFGWLLLGA
jgi:hypothetical protein